MTPNDEVLTRIYRDMVRTRVLDERLIASLREGKNPGSWHSGIGQEGIVAAVATLQKDDYCGYTHRGCYVWVTKGISIREILAEFYGKATGCSKGKGGTHIADLSVGIFGRSGTQGGHFPIAVGQALAAKSAGRGQVAMVFFGDGCSGRGTLHESMNMAAVWRLPVIWICENNGYSMGVPQSRTTTLKDLADLATAYSMSGTVVDGNDAIAVYEATSEAVQRARAGGGPSLIELKTYRLRGHAEGDPQRYRTREEIEEWRKRDPIERLEKQLLASGVLSVNLVAQIKTEAEAEVADADQFAVDSPWPDPHQAYEGVYAQEA